MKITFCDSSYTVLKMLLFLISYIFLSMFLLLLLGLRSHDRSFSNVCGFSGSLEMFPRNLYRFFSQNMWRASIMLVNLNIQTFPNIIVKPEVHIVSWATFQKPTRKLHLCGLTDNLVENTKLIKAIGTQVLCTAEIQTSHDSICFLCFLCVFFFVYFL